MMARLSGILPSRSRRDSSMMSMLRSVPAIGEAAVREFDVALRGLHQMRRRLLALLDDEF